MAIKLLFIGIILAIFYCLISAAYAMVAKRKTPEKMAKALTWRIGLSLLLFVFVIMTFLFGWVEPHTLLNLQN